jgi:hypothetical protein
MSRRFIFIIFTFLAVGALVFHIKEIIYPTQSTPAWRHAIFVLVNCICIYGLLKRPYWFIWFTALLTLQQLYSHGSYAFKVWQQHNVIDWISIGIVILLPVLLILLIFEKTKHSSNGA